nr:MAG TPA: hypothetical protein [Caudoviricetes sp.]
MHAAVELQISLWAEKRLRSRWRFIQPLITGALLSAFRKRRMRIMRLFLPISFLIRKAVKIYLPRMIFLRFLWQR